MEDSVLKQLIEASGGDYENFAAKLAEQHPARLGLILLELYAVRQNRYGAHPDFWNCLRVCQQREKQPIQQVARIDQKGAAKVIDDFKQQYQKRRFR